MSGTKINSTLRHPRRLPHTLAAAYLLCLSLMAGRAHAQAPSELPTLPASAELGVNQVDASWQSLFGTEPSSTELRSWRSLRATTPLGDEPLHLQSGVATDVLASALAALQADDLLRWERALLLPWVTGDARAAAWDALLASPERVVVDETGTATDVWLRRITRLRSEIAWNDVAPLLAEDCRPHPDARQEWSAANDALAQARWYRPASTIESSEEPLETGDPWSLVVALLRDDGDPATQSALSAQLCVPALWNDLLALERATDEDWALSRDALLLTAQRGQVPDAIAGRLVSAAYLRGDRDTLAGLAAALRAPEPRLYAPLPVLADALLASMSLAADLGGVGTAELDDAALDAVMFHLVTYPEPIMRWAHAELVRLRSEQITARTRLGAVLAADPFFAPALLSRSSTWVAQGMGAEAFADLLFLERAWADHPLYAPHIERLGALIR